MLLSDLSNLPGVSGNEDIVREYILNEINPFCDSVETDRSGNLIAFVKSVSGEKNVPKVMLCAHMDEVGLIVSGADRNGNVKFMPVGGIDPKVLPGCRVLIGDNDIKGIIGSKAIHLQSEAEFKKVFPVEALRIDIGSESRKQTESLVHPGDYVTFDTVFEEFGDGLLAGKALDDRAGCAILIETLRNLKRPSFDLYVCFSTKEEIGLLGARLLAANICPDIAIVVEGTTCADLPGIEEHMTSTKLRRGPVLSFMDGASVSNKALNNIIIETANENHIKWQFKNTITGGNDAGAIQISGKGVLTASVSVPCRYIHSPVSVISREDYDNAFYLMMGVIEKLSEMGGKINV